jgi:Outer membrane lipoprotein-sorting protein
VGAFGDVRGMSVAHESVRARRRRLKFKPMSRNFQRAALAVVLGWVLLAAVPARAESPVLRRLVHEADYVLRGQTTAALVTMRVHNKSYDRTYSMVYWADERGGVSRALIKILGPARWRGHGTLKIGGRLELYEPSTDRVTLLSSSMLGESWMGSDFTNDDLVKETDLAKDYTATELRQWSAKLSDSTPVVYHQILLRPTPKAPVSWDHIIVEVYEQGSHVIPVEEDYYRRAGQKTPTRTLQLTRVRTVGGRLAPTELTMRVAAKPGNFTVLRYDKVRFNADVPASKFTEQALRQ